MNILNKIDLNAYSLEIEEREVITYTGEKIICRKIFPPWVIDKNHELVNSLTQAVKKNQIVVGNPAKFYKYNKHKINLSIFNILYITYEIID